MGYTGSSFRAGKHLDTAFISLGSPNMLYLGILGAKDEGDLRSPPGQQV
jgi:hypothetical protein